MYGAKLIVSLGWLAGTWLRGFRQAVLCAHDLHVVFIVMHAVVDSSAHRVLIFGLQYLCRKGDPLVMVIASL